MSTLLTLFFTYTRFYLILIYPESYVPFILFYINIYYFILN